MTFAVTISHLKGVLEMRRQNDRERSAERICRKHKSEKMRNRRPLAVFVLILSLAAAALAQDTTKRLKPGVVEAGKISAGTTHSFTVELDKNRFALLLLEQKGIDLSIAAFGPDGKKIGDFDSPNGSNGPEYVSLETSLKGRYRLDVSPLSKSGSGGYDIRLVKVVPLAKTPEGRIEQLMAPWDDGRAPGASVAVAKDGKIVFSKGYGLANLEYGIKNSPTTVFHIASVSKQFTTFAALLLEADGKLSMDDDVRKYIPELHDFGKKITLRHLANHTSGLRDQWNLLALAGWRLDDVITREHILKLISNQKELNFEPGAEYLYCNTGYTLLAEVVTRVSGKSFAEFTEERIFKPLKMRNTLFYDDHEKIVKNRAYSYGPSPDGFEKRVLNYANVGATSLFTTVEDLSLWAMNFEDPVVGNVEIVRKMKERGVLNNGEKISYALGQTVGEYRGVETVSHGGGDAGYRTFLLRFPSKRLSITVFSNDGTFNAGSIAYKIADLYIPEPAPAAESEAAENGDPAADDAAVPVAVLDSYTGDWELASGTVANLSRQGARLVVSLGPQRFNLMPVSETKFTVDGPGIEIEFRKGADGKVDTFIWKQGNQSNTAKRVKPFAPDAEALKEYTGKFYSEELDTAYVFKVKDGKLVAEHQRHPDIVFTPVKKDEFNGASWFFGRAVFVRDASGTIISLKASSGRVRNVVFSKKGAQ